ncbi:MAG: hypothetical protein C5B47_06620 [Verrucomicrobia bacterium]|nr:MAG: hypothetical protein C5B47_06620 [Verrucomicrobiota bacterium]
MGASLVSLTIAHAVESGSRSLTNSELQRSSSSGTTIDVPVVDDGDTFSALREKQILLEATVRSLTDSLVQSNLDAETSRRQAADLALKLETFGIFHVDTDQPTGEQKLYSAVRALRDLKDQRDETRLELTRLVGAVLTLLKTADRVDPIARSAVEIELRRAKEMLGENNLETKTQTVSLDHATVVDVKDELSLVIVNVGRKQGVQLGMYFKVMRAAKELGTVRVVDVRDRICGAVIQNLSSVKQPIRQGDHLRVEIQR